VPPVSVGGTPFPVRTGRRRRPRRPRRPTGTRPTASRASGPVARALRHHTPSRPESRRSWSRPADLVAAMPAHHRVGFAAPRRRPASGRLNPSPVEDPSQVERAPAHRRNAEAAW